MDLRTVSQRIAVLHKLLEDGDVKTIVLVGESGIGKTWMAREISNWAIREGLFDLTVSVFFDRARGEPPTYDINALRESIARQFSLRPIIDEWDVEDAIEEPKEEEKQEQEISKGIREKKFLLIVDVADRVELSDDKILSEFKTMPELNLKSSDKVLITRRQTISSHGPHGPEHDTRVIELLPLTESESFTLLQERAGTNVFVNPQIIALAKDFIGRTKRLPAAFILLAKALNYFQESDSRMRVLESALEEASENKCYSITQLLSSGYNMVPSTVLIDLCWQGSHFLRDLGSIDCNELIAYWMLEGYLGPIDSIEKAYEEGHRVLMELIDCQLLKSMDGGNICMDEGNVNLLLGISDIKEEDKHTSSHDILRRGFCGTATLGMATVFNGKWKGLGRISHTQGMMSTICSPEQGQKLSTLLLDGNLFSKAFLHNMFQSSEELQVLFLSNWKLHFEEKGTDNSLLGLLSNKRNLSVLLLRDCELLENVDLTMKLHNLVVLEISGCSSLKSMPDDFFKGMTDLRSLNLSELPISLLPTSLYDLSKLLWLVLRGCSCLTKLESLKNMSELMVLDLSGATSLTKIVDTSFSKNTQLQMLNCSQTQISIPPFFRYLGRLTHLILSGCENINRLRSLDPLTSLQVLDLSGARIFNRFHNFSLGKDVSLDVLDLSGTSIEQLPSNIGDPLHLYLKGCYDLSELPFIETLKRLEVLDVSGTLSLTEIRDTFFENLGNLQNVNLSRTSIKTIPSLSNLRELRQLLLSHCLKLKKLPSLNSVKNLEVLDLSGCKSLEELHGESFEQMCRLQKLDLTETKIECLPSLSNLCSLRQLILDNCTSLKCLPPLEFLSKLEELNLHGVTALRESSAEFLKHMNHLQILNLSDTQLKGLPSLSNLANLKQLLLGHCSLLETVPELVELINLEVLDLSGTAIKHLPSLDRFSRLRKLLLRDCSSLSEFLHLEVLDLLGDTSRELPYSISKLTCIEQLDLPDMNVTQGVDFSETNRSSEDLNEHLWSISSLPVETLSSSKRGPASVNGAQFLHLLNENPSLWDTRFRKFHFSVHPMGCNDLYANELVLGGTCFRTSQFFRFKKEQLLEIRGFDHCPRDIEAILRHVNCLLLVDNTFRSWLSDLGASNLGVLKGCWFDRCSKLVSVFQPEEMEDVARLGETLEVLGVSNAVNLRTIFSGNLKYQTFQNLEKMYLDCCPELSFVFNSSILPQRLRVLHVQFCDKIEELFEEMSPDSGMPKLETLHLLELPKLKSIGGTLPSLQTLSVRHCDNLERLFEPSTASKCKLTMLRTLLLQELPKLTMIGATFPSLELPIVTGCPNCRDSPVASGR